MKIPLTLITLILINFSLAAKSKSFNKDTINLIGVLYTSNGTPATNVIVRSQQTNSKTGVIAVTDQDGLFSLNGLMVNDTLTIESIKYDKLHYYNKGSRLMVIFLPPERTNDLNSKNPIEITAKRVIPKVIPASEIILPKNTSYYILQNPEFPGGNENFLTYINRKLTYPDKALQNNIEGSVEISFTVGKDGKLNNFNVLKGIGYGCDDEVLKILAQSPSWKPGIMNGFAVTENVSVSVKFSLTDN